MALGRLALFAAGGVGFVIALALDGGGPGGDGDRPASRDADAERFVRPAVADRRAEPEPSASDPASPAIERVSDDAVDARAEATTDARAKEPAVAEAEAPPVPEAEAPPVPEAEHPAVAEDPVSPVVVRLVDGAIRALVDAERARVDAERERIVANLVTAATAAVVARAEADAKATAEATAANADAVAETPARARSVLAVASAKSAMSVSRPAPSARGAPRAVTFADDARSPPSRVPSDDVPSTPARAVPPPTVCESPFIVAGGAKRLIRGEGGRGLVRRRDHAPAPPRGGPPLADARADADEEALGEIAEEPRTPGPKFGAADPRLAFKTPGPVLPDTPDSAASDESEGRGEETGTGTGTGTEDVSPGDGAVKLHVSLDDWSRPGFVAASRAGTVRYSSEMDADDGSEDDEKVNDENADAVSVPSGKGLASALRSGERRALASEGNAA